MRISLCLFLLHRSEFYLLSSRNVPRVAKRLLVVGYPGGGTVVVVVVVVVVSFVLCKKCFEDLIG